MSIFSDTRYIKPEASFRLVDQTAQPDCTPSCSDEGEYSHIAQTIDDVLVSTKKLLTLEHNLWTLDGSYEAIDSASGLDTGWISEEISDEEGNINTKLIFSFGQQHTSFGLTIQYDEKADSFPTEYTIRSYRNGAVVATIPVENDGYRAVIQSGLATYDKIEITFEKTSLPCRRVHVTEVLFGIVETFDDNSIISFTINREISSKCDSIPVGEITLKFDNSNNRYDIINPTGAYRYLKYGMPLRLRIGIGESPNELEYYDTGTFYFYKAETEDDGMTAVFTCQDALTYLDRLEYTGTGGNINLNTLITAINNQIEGLTWNNQIGADTFKGPDSGEVRTIREVLRDGCEALRAVCYVDTDETIQLRRIQDGENIFDYTADRVASYPKVSTDSRVTKVIVEYGENLSTYAEDREPDEIEQIVKYSPDGVNTASLALLLAEYLLNDNRKFKYEIEGRGNPEINMLDMVKVYDKYENSHVVIVTAHDLRYDGGLSETIKAVGGIIE